VGEAKRRKALLNNLNLPAQKQFEDYANIGKLLFPAALLNEFAKSAGELAIIAAKLFSKDDFGLPHVAQCAMCFDSFLAKWQQMESHQNQHSLINRYQLSPIDLLKSFCCAHIKAQQATPTADIEAWLAASDQEQLSHLTPQAA
jgi:hypothetical protein